MPREYSKTLRKWFAWAMLVLLIISVAVWYFTRDTLPREIIIATAVPGGMYDEVGKDLAEILAARTGHPVTARTTAGSPENADLLRKRKAHAAVIQAGSTPLNGLSVVAPLHPDVVQVLIRQDEASPPLARRSIADLAGKRVAIGKPQSGMQHAARTILGHYKMLDDVTLEEVHFTALLNDDGLYGAIVTTGLENDDIKLVMESGLFEMVSLNAKALSRKYPHFEEHEVPAQFWPPLPETDVQTVATNALVVVREDAQALLVRHLLDAVYEENLNDHFATVISQSQAVAAPPRRLHPVARRYHNPYGTYGFMHSILEALAAGKELLFALGAGLYLAWDRWRRIKEKEIHAEIKAQKERLDAYLDKTLSIERAQMDESDPAKLQQYLDEVTDIKLQALNQLSHEGLRGDRTFSIFLMQCANLISKIQLKIINSTSA